MSKYITKQRKLLISYLSENADRALTAEQIASELTADKISLSAVYRNLAELEEDGQVTRITSQGSRETYYRYSGAEECRGCLHLSCMKCGKTVHMKHDTAEKFVSEVSTVEGFTVNRKNTVIYGICDNCNDDGEDS